VSDNLGKITIARRFCGPPESGNGGYVAGLLGNFFDGPAEVTLRLPPPLEVEMNAVRTESGVVCLMHEGEIVAEAISTEFELDVPAPPSFAESEQASLRFDGFHQHTFPGCFVCGPERNASDGLRVFAGRVAENGLHAAPWVPHASLADAEGATKAEFIWAALDCPGAFSLGMPERPVVLGRLAVKIIARPQAGKKCVVTGWQIGGEGRKFRAGTSLFDEDGKMCAVSRATWIALKTAPSS